MRRLLLSAGLIGLLGLGSAKAQSVSTWAGTGVQGYTQKTLQRTRATLSFPWGMARDSKNRIWVTFNDSAGGVLVIDPTKGKFEYRASDRTNGGFQDATGTTAKWSNTQGIAIDSKDTIFVVDWGNNAIRRIAPYVSVGSQQSVYTVAGGGTGLSMNTTGESGYKEAKGTDALFNGPAGIGIDPVSGDLIVADNGNQIIRGIKRDKANYGKTYLIAGQQGNTIGDVDGDALTKARFNSPTGIWVDPSNGDIYVTEQSGNIRKLTKASAYKVSTIYLDPNKSMAEGSAIGMTKVNGNYYIAYGCKIVKSTLDSKTNPTVVAGLAGTFATGDTCAYKDGAGKQASFNSTAMIIPIANDTLLVADMLNHAIRKIDLTGKFTGVETPQASTASGSFRMYPNPANDYVTIENISGNASEATISLFDMTGKRVSLIQTNLNGTYELPLQAYSKGLYILKMQSGNESFSQKLIISR